MIDMPKTADARDTIFLPRKGRRALLLGTLLGMALPGLGGTAPEEPAAAEVAHAKFQEAFQKGPVTVHATVLRPAGSGQAASLPLFQVPLLKFQDRLELAFSGEAFDRRVTRADWSLVVVFLPRTVAPTEQGVVDAKLVRKGDRMAAASITVPYDSIPMLFLVPDTGGRKKILADLSAHLAEFRDICLKLSDLTEERAHADRFLHGLEAIDKGLGAAVYDSTVLNYLNVYGSQLSLDFQTFLNRNSVTNQEKLQFVTREFSQTSLQVPAEETSKGLKIDTTTLPTTSTSAYVSIAFDLARIIQNLWPGHKFQYIPALAKDFSGFQADLYYGDWIHTTGDVRGALVCSPCRWEDATSPDFGFEVGPECSLLRPDALLKVAPKPGTPSPFALFGQAWKLVLTAPDGKTLAPLALEPNPARSAFVVAPGPALEALRGSGLPQATARIVGRWGFQSIASAPVSLPLAPDPAWRPTSAELDALRAGSTAVLHLPPSWAPGVEKLRFRPAESGLAAVEGRLLRGKDGAWTATLELPAEARTGALELVSFGAGRAALALPLTLRPPLPVVERLEAHQGEAQILLAGAHLDAVASLVANGQSLKPSAQSPSQLVFQAAAPLEAAAGAAFGAELRLKDGSSLALKPATVLGPRPRLAEIELIPAGGPPPALEILSDAPLASASLPARLSLVTEGRYRFPAAVRVMLRNAEFPTEARQVPPAHLRFAGGGKRLLASFQPTEILGGRAYGKLEVQVQDERAGSSEWRPLPALFLDLPALAAFRPDPAGNLLLGPSLESVESAATLPSGPWRRLAITLRENQEAAPVPPLAPDGTFAIRLFGWPELPLRVRPNPR